MIQIVFFLLQLCCTVHAFYLSLLQRIGLGWLSPLLNRFGASCGKCSRGVYSVCILSTHNYGLLKCLCAWISMMLYRAFTRRVNGVRGVNLVSIERKINSTSTMLFERCKWPWMLYLFIIFPLDNQIKQHIIKIHSSFNIIDSPRVQLRPYSSVRRLACQLKAHYPAAPLQNNGSNSTSIQ